MSEHKYLTPEELSILGSCRPTSPIAIAVHRILSDLDALRAELKAAQKDRGRIQMYLDDATAEVARLNMRLNEKDAEIARLREDNHKIALAVYPHKNPHYPFSTSTEFIVEEIHRLHRNQAELDRMRKALEQYGVYLESGHDADLNRFFLMREKALNPQTAQPEKP